MKRYHFFYLLIITIGYTLNGMTPNLNTIPNAIKTNIVMAIANDSIPENAGESLRALYKTTVGWKQHIDNVTHDLIRYNNQQYNTNDIIALYIGTPVSMRYAKEKLDTVILQDDKQYLDRILKNALDTYSGSKQANIIMWILLVKYKANFLLTEPGGCYFIEKDQNKPQTQQITKDNRYSMITFKKYDGKKVDLYKHEDKVKWELTNQFLPPNLYTSVKVFFQRKKIKSKGPNPKLATTDQDRHRFRKLSYTIDSKFIEKILPQDKGN